MEVVSKDEMTVTPMNMCEIVAECDEPDRIPSKDRVTYWDVVALVISISSHIIDIGLDINLAYRYYTSQYSWNFVLTLGFIVVPAWINTAFSIRMLVASKNVHPNNKIYIFHLCFYFVSEMPE